MPFCSKKQQILLNFQLLIIFAVDEEFDKIFEEYCQYIDNNFQD